MTDKPNRYKNITIKDAITKIENNELLIPAFQRGYVWKAEQVEALFNSIINDYPIGTFLFWEQPNNKPTCHKFLKDYSEYEHIVNGKNYGDPITAEQNVSMVIDGQQRLTSLYIGLKGTYANRIPHCWYDKPESYPERSLYLCLQENTKTDKQPPYFRLLTEKEYQRKQTEGFWIKVKDIPSDKAKINTLPNITDKQKQILETFHNTIYKEEIINYYTTNKENSDIILDIFIQVNSKGTRLTKSDLLMSLTVAKWDQAKTNFRDLISKIKQIDFTIDNDFILKTCLVLTANKNSEITFRIENVEDKIEQFKNDWNNIENSITKAFTLIKELGFTDFTTPTKTAIIPIIYWLFKHNQKTNQTTEINISQITKWLMFAYIYGLFTSHYSDPYLNKAKEIIDSTLNLPTFPANQINNEYKEYAKTQLNEEGLKFEINDEFLEELLKSQYNTPRAAFILGLLYPNVIIKAKTNNQLVHQDHLHPIVKFDNKNEEFNKAFTNPEDKSYALDKNNCNGVLNLQLLPANDNKAKNATNLETWYNNQKEKLELYIDSDISLKLCDFRKFIDSRRINLKAKLKEILESPTTTIV